MHYANRYAPGVRFGRLTVVRQTERPAGHRTEGRWYVFQCDCGNTALLPQGAVRNGGTQSCGCLRRERAAALSVETAKRKGSSATTVAGFLELVRRYRKGATARGLAFTLSRRDLERLFQSPCQYCGAAPAMVARPPGKHCTQPPYVANGIDRVDNTRGYTPYNSVSCCSTCNHMKSSRTVASWVLHMRKVLAHLQK